MSATADRAAATCQPRCCTGLPVRTTSSMRAGPTGTSSATWFSNRLPSWSSIGDSYQRAGNSQQGQTCLHIHLTPPKRRWFPSTVLPDAAPPARQVNGKGLFDGQRFRRASHHLSPKLTIPKTASANGKTSCQRSSVSTASATQARKKPPHQRQRRRPKLTASSAPDYERPSVTDCRISNALAMMTPPPRGSGIPGSHMAGERTERPFRPPGCTPGAAPSVRRAGGRWP